MATVHLTIKGKVQGVFYRVTAKKVADKLHIKGWIKNTEDGSVEALVSGTDADVQEFTAWCKTGPEKAEVTDVIVMQRQETIFTDFEIIRGK